MSKKEAVDSVIHDMAHLPAGFVPLGQICGESGASALYGYVDRKFRRGDLQHGRFKCRGKLFVHKDDLDRCREEFENRKPEPKKRCDSSQQSATSQQLDAAITALVRIDNGISLMQATLDRLATAVESIATQPRTPQQELLHAISSNGFDS